MKNNSESIAIKMILYVILFAFAGTNKHIVKWFMNMQNMAAAMILMAVVMIVNYVWELIHAK